MFVKCHFLRERLDFPLSALIIPLMSISILAILLYNYLPLYVIMFFQTDFLKAGNVYNSSLYISLEPNTVCDA